MRITVLDDYQDVARTNTDWSAVTDDLDVVTEHIAGVDELVVRLADSEVVVAMRERTPFPATTLQRLPNLRLLVTTGGRNASIDLAAARECGITVCGTGAAGNAMPELVIGMLIALSRHFVEEDRAVRAGGWQHTIGPGLSGRTLGLVGLGRLGTAVATLARAFGMQVIAWSPHLTAERAAEAGVRAVGKQEVFKTADFVSVHLVLSDSTRGLIGADELRAMKPTAFFLNTSRGPIVDEAALLDVLDRQAIAGAGLDVYDTEPLPADHPLRSTTNTLLLPHIGYVTTEAYEAFYAGAVEDIVAFRAGRPLRQLEVP
ncbi:D-2-hydroxyacid dehydrogenase family protein [Modestobacter versicolor]|uniref:D-2-hydroxyacid dehydrogenase family protein n=1 Tax=Modestobacter versicolor TaxID=429133 RepID=A0A323VER5_9ACTN|nr:D-2-hydroxyacid dehydrogenase family protein [Modestobacter versicolor]MBB3674344.1 phosphoglycerate dehydrogenase-like enzyme [Modestobacter versicolor]PZA23111.1 D-2-hydroxyacid dehydrogenase family protein [Modestobacter versicolor]